MFSEITANAVIVSTKILPSPCSQGIAVACIVYDESTVIGCKSNKFFGKFKIKRRKSYKNV